MLKIGFESSRAFSESVSLLGENDDVYQKRFQNCFHKWGGVIFKNEKWNLEKEKRNK